MPTTHAQDWNGSSQQSQRILPRWQLYITTAVQCVDMDQGEAMEGLSHLLKTIHRHYVCNSSLANSSLILTRFVPLRYLGNRMWNRTTKSPLDPVFLEMGIPSPGISFS